MLELAFPRLYPHGIFSKVIILVKDVSFAISTSGTVDIPEVTHIQTMAKSEWLRSLTRDALLRSMFGELCHSRRPMGVNKL